MTYEQLIKTLKNKVEKAGGVRAFARAVDSSPTYVSMLLRGKIKKPGVKFLAQTGYEVIVKTEYRLVSGKGEKVYRLRGERVYKRLKKPPQSVVTAMPWHD